MIRNSQSSTPLMTARQMQVLRLIRDFRLANGYSPSLRELASALGTSRTTAYQHLQALERKRILCREKNKKRNFRPVNDEGCPLCGRQTKTRR